MRNKCYYTKTFLILFELERFELIIRDNCFLPPICPESYCIFRIFEGKIQNWAPIQACFAMVPIFLPL